ncbi:beta-agarase [Aureibaculum marinum]|uniref:Beta-agarase n=1 Tax=Aureibaculum marinum TaxID=2487930 RepID=A0A3N4P2C3_9FLAO|nr:beta-galactosidase [Aureibaculum marinum]RPD99116.1 beta-agarase [Aureibaculum marinum]
MDLTRIFSKVGGMGFIFLVAISCNSRFNKEEVHRLVLFDFEDQAQTEFVKPQDATFKLVKDKDNSHIQVNNGFTLRETGVKLLSPENKPWDLSGYYQIRADVSNVGDEKMQVELFVGNDPDGLLRWYCSDYVDLAPGESKTIVVDLAWTPWIFKPQIDVKGMRGVPGKIKANLTQVTELTFCSRYATQSNSFTVDNVWAEGKYEERSPDNFFPFIDEFGQYIHDNWKGKMLSDIELKEKAKLELDYLSKATGPKERGTFGGWTGGPKLEATGFFRTEKVDGKWWIVDPEGYLFWTVGLNCVASDAVFTGISHRENYFANLPGKDSDFGQFYGKGSFAIHGFYKDKLPYDTYNFYQSNLYRKYGDDWLATFQDVAHKRIKDWGMNTIGFMSDFGATRQHRTPYVGSVWINDTPKIEGSEGFWGEFHDVFDPSFRVAVRNSILSQKEGANDPYCIGYFVDNELSWGQLGSLSIGTLKSPATQYAKKVFVNDLKRKYVQIDKLNKVWGTDYQSWEALLKATASPDHEKAKADLVAFYEKIAKTYFKTINEELKKVAPNQNYLGCRFAWANNDVVLTAASEYLDIISFNKYEYSVADFKLPEGVDKPVMIGEFHFGALDRGSFHVGIKKAKDQAERGQMFQDYIQGALKHPNIVGAHWFQYIDEPNTGRFDGENYNVGFLDICDNPYEELIEKVKETTYSLYEYRTNNI